MTEPATFDEEDWRSLTGSDKKAISSVGLGFEPLSSMPGVGQKSMDALIAKGLAVEGPGNFFGRTFKQTDKGGLAGEWLQGRKIRVFPTD